MRIIAHLSDLHFGRIHLPTLQPIVRALLELQPDVVAVSGDLTQRARPGEFLEARAFLERLPFPKVIVPGNHDVPLYNAAERFLAPFRAYRRYVTPDLAPTYMDREVALAGVNTARPFRFAEGLVSRYQAERVKAAFDALPRDVIRIVVSHHPFDVPEHSPHGIVGRARMAMEIFAAANADLFLAGHLHVSHTAHTAERYRIAGHSALIVQAGTATSTRGRGEPNTFNVLRIDRPSITVERWSWDSDAGAFAAGPAEQFLHGEHGWRPATAPTA